MTTPDNLSGYVTSCGSFAAVPYGTSNFIILHNGEQIRLCRNITTARKFINEEMKKLK
jgi:hypothetical protein